MATETGQRLAVIGGGWSGLAAAVRAVEAGQRVTLFEAARQLGGRARSVSHDGTALDNGQHILIGAYHRTLALMRTVGVEPETVLARQPFELRFSDGRGLRVPAGPSWIAFARGVAGAQGWSATDRLRFGFMAMSWALAGFRCDPQRTVAELAAQAPSSVRELLLEPLCIAALNTSARDASATVMLRVLQDALFGDRGSSDLLLPRQPLSALLPDPAAAWLCAAGAELRLGHRVLTLQAARLGWLVDGEFFDHVVLACPPREAARLVAQANDGWAALATGFAFEPIVTVYLRARGARLPASMTALPEGPLAPAQFAFDHGALGATPGLFAFVISGARGWVERGQDDIARGVLAQAESALNWTEERGEVSLVRVLTEKRATFRCTPGLRRPPSVVATRLAAAGDHVAGPYPATLEGAVRAGEEAIRLLMA